ncbi:chorismate mutase [Erythrobacter sp. LQ02-29]|uniref:chorismate mutase n=1 Tax=Erythrobacter sp. LQ02-29 TaxID=2920384 RepID=UPI001F4EFA62|nr:chorismate mutase [Erythrobacter sp. LQ02-29]MCP9223110.1 chorismate mutase [Erythrobacter sp. LQ02-29]
MTNAIKSPENCQTMPEVRTGVDATDRALMTLLEQRFGYMRAAARIKQDRDSVRDEARKRAVIEAAMADGIERGLPGDVIAEIWDRLVEGSIAYELDEWDRQRA